MNARRALAAIAASSLEIACGGPMKLAPPPTPVRPVSEVLHGETVVDPYRWLEEDESPEVAAWTAAQNAHTSRFLAGFDGREALRAAIDRAFRVGWVSAPEVASGRAFWLEQDGDRDQPVLLEGPADGSGTPRVLVDPNALAGDGTAAIDWFHVAPSGGRVAYGISRGGDERSTLHVLDVDAPETRWETIPGTRAASLAWLPDASGFYYTRYPVAGSRYFPAVEEEEATYHRHVYFHALGTDPMEDARVFGEDLAPEEWPSVDLDPSGRHLVVTVSVGWSETRVYVRETAADPKAPWREVAARPGTRDEAVPADEALFLFSDHEAPRGRVLRLAWDAPGVAHAVPVVPEHPTRVLETVSLVAGRLAVTWLEDASSRLTVHEQDGRLAGEVSLPAIGTISGIGGDRTGGDLFYSFSSYSTPAEVARVHLDPVRPGGSFRTAPDPGGVARDAGAFEVSIERFRSSDGTPLTMFVTRRKGLPKDGRAPAVLYGYGGFNVSLTPDYARNVQPFLRAGGVYAVAHLRGGGEYGESWHEAGMLDRKENVFRDFESAADHLVRSGWTSPERLAVLGGSNGGLLTGAAVVRFPEKFRAAVVQVPLLDMLRYPRFLLARLWIPEYGDPEEPAAFRWLRAYSPYHHVPDPYTGPAVFLLAAESDTRVHPLHARKFAALLQARNRGPNPVLLRVETRAGHGAGKPRSKVVEEYVDIWTFLFEELGIDEVPL